MKNLLPILGVFLLLFPTITAANDADTSTEKIFERAKRLADHELIAESIPLFEQIIAREPENRDYRVEAADWVTRTRSMETEEDARLRVRTLTLAMDWTENLPIEKYEHIWQRGHWETPAARKDEPALYPEWFEDLEKLHHRYLANWRECHAWLLNNLLNAEDRSKEDEKIAYEKYVYFVVSSDFMAQTLPVELSAQAIDDAFSGLLQVFDGTDSPRHVLDRKSKESLRHRFFEGMMVEYSSFADRQGNSPHSEKTRDSLRRSAEKLKASKIVYLSVYGRLLEHLLETPEVEVDQHNYKIRKTVFRAENTDETGKLHIVFDNEQQKKEIEFIQSIVDSLPPETPRGDVAVLHDIRRKLGGGFSVTISSRSVSEDDEERQTELVEAMPFSVLYPESEAGALRSLELIGQTEKNIRDKAEAEGQSEHEVELAVSHIAQTRSWLQRKAGTVKYATPWKEKVDLLPPLHWGQHRLYVEPVIQGNRLYVFEINIENKSARCLTVNLDDRSVIESEWITMVLDGMKDNPDHASWENPSPCGPWRFYSSFADENNAYLGTAAYGILVFPADQSKPWRLGTAEGLPSDIVQGLGTIGGVLYAGLGERRGVTSFVRVELGRGAADCRVEILSRTIDESGKAPFANAPASTQFHPFVLDAKRNRLLFTVHMDRYPTPRTAGVWSIDGESGEISQIPDLFGSAEKMEILPDGETLLLATRDDAGTLDLRDNKFTLVSASLYGTETETYATWNRKMKPTLGRAHRFDVMTMADGWVWRMRRESGVQCFWSRVKLDDPRQWSLLELPDGMNPEEDGWFPDYEILAHPNGKAVIGCETHRVVLFRW